MADQKEAVKERRPGPRDGADDAGDPPLRALRRRLAPGVVEMARNDTTALAPGILHEDVSFYLDADRYEREYQRLFRAMPLVACLSSQLPEPGSFRTFDDAGVPILLT